MYYYAPFRYPYHHVNGPNYFVSNQFSNTPYDNNNENNVQWRLRDFGPAPFVVNINDASKQNQTFRTALWTGRHLQVTLMSLNVGEEIGLENHPSLDQFLRIEQGKGIVRMGRRKDHLDFVRPVYDDSAVMIPAGTWHNLINTGAVPLKLYSIYAPPNHPHSTVHQTKAEAMAAENHQNNAHRYPWM